MSSLFLYLVSDDVTSVIATQEQKSLLHPNAKSKVLSINRSSDNGTGAFEIFPRSKLRENTSPFRNDVNNTKFLLLGLSKLSWRQSMVRPRMEIFHTDFYCFFS